MLMAAIAKHLTVESYMVIYAPSIYTYGVLLLLLVFHHPLSLSFQT